MTPVSISYQETGMLLPVSDNRQILHGKVYSAISEASGEKKERDFIYSVKEDAALNGMHFIMIRSQSLPSSAPAVKRTMTFEPGGSIACSIQLVNTAQIPGERYKYRERRADEINEWLSALVERHGFFLKKATWGSRHADVVERKGKSFKIPSLWCQLELTVTEPDKAASAWLNGIGRKKGYGFGMMEALHGE